MVKDAELRFEFGKNWGSFSEKIDDVRVEIAKLSLQEMFGFKRLDGKTFLDVGCGSGIFSLAAVQLGAKVLSFDFDEASVATTKKLKSKFSNYKDDWRVIQGSILDKKFIKELGNFDLVYCWGVAHHTGAMWIALSHLKTLVNANGQLCVAIYNDQGWKSRAWWILKRLYCSVPANLKNSFVVILGAINISLVILRDLCRWDFSYIKKLRNYKESRGMSLFTDLRDWYGGFPYEFAGANILQDFYEIDGFTLEMCKTETGIGCNEMVFRK